MSKDKQVDEMAKDIHTAVVGNNWYDTISYTIRNLRYVSLRNKRKEE